MSDERLTLDEAMLVIEALTRLVREEWPPYPLHEIVAIWGGSLTEDHHAALRKLPDPPQ